MTPFMRLQLAAALVLNLGGGLQSQAPPPDYLGSGIARIRAGEFQLGIMMLNEVVASWSKADAATVARAHAYRAQAFLGLNQPEDARAAALLALKANPAIVIRAADYSPDVVRLFEEMRRPVKAVSPEVAAAVAEQSGNDNAAFAAYVAAYQALPNPAPADADRRLREKIIALAQRMTPPPVIPDNARAHYAKAEQLIEAQAVLGAAGTSSLEAAARELQGAIRIAPWWGDAAWQLATVLQRLQHVDAALLNLNLYRIADPDGYARATAGTAPAAPPAARAETSSPAPRTASLYIYWPPQTREKGAPKVYCDGTLIGELKKGRFIAIAVPGGTHTIKLNKVEAFSFEPGKSYYLRASIEGFARWTPLTVRMVDPAEAEEELRQKSVAPNDAKHTYTHQCGAPAAAGR